MELEALKSLAFASGCRLLHLHLIENHETILLLPRFGTSPTDLHVAVSQALLSLVTSVRSFDRPYLSYLSALLLDLFVFLRGQVTLPMAAFTQQSVLTGLLEAVLSPVVQQRQEEKSCWLRGQLYLPLLSFLTYSFSRCLISRLAIQQNTFDLLPSTSSECLISSGSLIGTRHTTHRSPRTNSSSESDEPASPE